MAKAKVSKKKAAKKAAKTMTFKSNKDVNAFMLQTLELKPSELKQEAMAYLALLLIKKGEVIEWKALVDRFNARRKGLPQASRVSDPSAGAHDGFNIRNQWFNFEHDSNTGCHAQGSGALSLKSANVDSVLAKKLVRRFFKAAK